jgi:hypothetical protein
MHGRGTRQTSSGTWYSTDTDHDYIRLCHGCHRRYDRGAA